jgi:hypothetical protein
MIGKGLAETWSYPCDAGVVLVEEKDGTMDYMPLDINTTRNVDQLPIIDDLLHRLQ